MLHGYRFSYNIATACPIAIKAIAIKLKHLVALG